MLRLLKLVLIIVVLLAAVIVGYAYLGDLSPEQQDVDLPVDLDAGQ